MYLRLKGKGNTNNNNNSNNRSSPASRDDRDWTTRTEEKLLNDTNLYGKRIVLGNSRLAQSCTGKCS